MRNGPIRLTIFPVTERGFQLAQKLTDKFNGAKIHEPVHLKNGGLKKLVKVAFRQSSAIFFISASGIAIRAVAPFLKGKAVDPAVILMDEGARFVVSLLSGHLGGANKLTKEIAQFYKAAPVITTATDVMGLPCAEDIAESIVSKIENIGKIKPVNSAILKNERIAVIDKDSGRLDRLKREFGENTSFSFHKSLPKKTDVFSGFILVSSSLDKLPPEIENKTLVLRPPEFVVGLGCNRGVRVKEVAEAFSIALDEAGIPPLCVRNLASIDIKSNEQGLLKFAKKKGLEIRFFSSTELRKIKKLPSGVSELVLEKTGVGGVCEPAALLCSGAKKIWLKKRRIGRVTVAAAKVP
ncbi:MAG: cobalamin biosynthesis protein [Deltaproteobacteria bacterium]|nr:cobalamin biosynthesis protein [Deltaproteobacteria bacterium]